MRKSIIPIIFALLTLPAAAQKRVQELGLFLGGSYYTGDLNPNGHFNSLTKPAGGVVHRYNLNDRFTWRNGIFLGTIAGDDARSASFSQQQRNLSFKSKLYEFHSVAEFNFLEYEIGDEKRMFTPFMFAGVDVFNFSPKGLLGNQWVGLQQLHTEAQSKPYKLTQVAIPFGAGIKTMLAKRIGLVLEWGLRKTFTDYLDDVSTVYANPADIAIYSGSLGVVMADRNTSSDPISNIGRQRGNPRTKDWYSFAGVTLSFKLKEQQKRCASYNY